MRLRTVELSGIRFLAPGCLWLLVVPLAALWLGARGGAVLALVTGTLESWRAAERSRPAEVQRKRRVPPALVCLAAALSCAALALARPERSSGTAARHYTLVVDRSPSLALVEGGRTRRERALEPVEAWIARERLGAGELEWIEASAPDWPRYDRADALWISDHFDLLPRSAGFSASGGAAVPGPIAREGAARLDWDGTRVVRVENAFTAQELGCSIDARLPEPLRELARLWAERRGLAPGGSALFVFALEPAGEVREVELARDGWSAHGQVGAPLAPAAGETSWLVAGGPCVVVSPGRVRTSIVALEEPAGDPAAFAVSWAELFDSVLLDPPGVVPLGERTARGAPGWRPPAGSGAGAGAAPRPLAGWCALLASLLALGAWVLRGIRA